MNYFAFILLSQADKLKELWRNGTLIAERNDRTHHYELYQVENFYVEKQIDFSGRMLQISKTFKSLYYLDPYLENIDTSSLYTR
jgi:phenylalanyl-tRNA synthetase alpha subunit